MFDFPMPWDVEEDEDDNWEGPILTSVVVDASELPPAIDPAGDQALEILYDARGEVAQEGEHPVAWLILQHAIEYLYQEQRIAGAAS